MTVKYTCAHCGGTFTSERPDEEAHEEAKQLWGRDGRAPDMAVICEVCFQQMMTWARANGELPQ